jgi:hypothetical protein
MADEHTHLIRVACEAIERRHRLAIVYKDEIRVVDPYIVGYDADGRLLLSAVQVLGGSGSGFRTFAAKDIVSLAVTEQKFLGNHPGYNRRDRLFAGVICQV